MGTEDLIDTIIGGIIGRRMFAEYDLRIFERHNPQTKQWRDSLIISYAAPNSSYAYHTAEQQLQPNHIINK